MRCWLQSAMEAMSSPPHSLSLSLSLRTCFLPTTPHPGKDAKVLHASQTIMIGKNDFWASEGKQYFSHLSAPALTINWTNPTGSTGKGGVLELTGNVTQDMGNARVTAVMAGADNSSSLTTSYIAGENGTNAILTTITCRRREAGCEVDLILHGCCGTNPLVSAAGGSDSEIWIRKENLRTTTNPAYTGSCNADQLYYNIQRSFQVSSTDQTFTMTNGSCPWVLDPANATHSDITTGACNQPQGKWTWHANANATMLPAPAAASGQIVWTGGASNALCLSTGAKLVACTAGASTIWTLHSGGPTDGFLSASTNLSAGGCLMVVPDNSNNTLASATTIVETVSGKVLVGKGPAVLINASNPSLGVRYSVTLEAGVSYTIVTAVMTLRDVGCAGTREQTEKCAVPSIEAAASAHAASFAAAGTLLAATATHAAFWERFWTASSIDLTGGSATAHPNATEIEKWYAFFFRFVGHTTLLQIKVLTQFFFFQGTTVCNTLSGPTPGRGKWLRPWSVCWLCRTHSHGMINSRLTTTLSRITGERDHQIGLHSFIIPHCFVRDGAVEPHGVCTR